MTREREKISITVGEENKRNKRQGEREVIKKHTITVHARGSESGWKMEKGKGEVIADSIVKYNVE